MADRQSDEIAKLYASDLGAAAPLPRKSNADAPRAVETRPDVDRDIDHQGILEHAANVVGAKAESDRRRFLRLYEQAISLFSTIAVLLGTMLVVSVGAYFVIALLQSVFRVQ